MLPRISKLKEPRPEEDYLLVVVLEIRVDLTATRRNQMRSKLVRAILMTRTIKMMKLSKEIKSQPTYSFKKRTAKTKLKRKRNS